MDRVGVQMVAVPREAYERLLRAAQEVCQAPYASTRETAVSALREAGQNLEVVLRQTGHQRVEPFGAYALRPVQRSGWVA